MAWLNSLIKEGWLETERIIKAFEEIDRKDFLPADKKDLAGLNQALPIGHGQTISQPLVVAFMLEKLEPQPGHKILDIGSGSGWTTALLSHIVGGRNKQNRSPSGSEEASRPPQTGKVIGVEIVPELKEFGEKNVAEYNFVEKEIAEFVCEDGTKGFKKEAPYDRILASASARELPSAWKKQVKVGGKIVTPIGHSIFIFTKQEEQEFTKERHMGFSFVPLINENDA